MSDKLKALFISNPAFIILVVIIPSGVKIFCNPTLDFFKWKFVTSFKQNFSSSLSSFFWQQQLFGFIISWVQSIVTVSLDYFFNDFIFITSIVARNVLIFNSWFLFSIEKMCVITFHLFRIFTKWYSYRCICEVIIFLINLG